MPVSLSLDDFNEGESQARQPSEQDIEEARKATGIDNPLYRFAIGAAKPFADTAMAAQQGYNYVTGDDQKLQQLKDTQTQNNEGFDKFSGTAGTLGDITSNIALGAVPLGAGLGALKALPAAARVAASGTLAGAASGAISPADNNNSFLSNVGMGALGGALFGSTLGAGSWAASKLISKLPANKAARDVQELINSSLANMPQEEQDKFHVVLGNMMTKSPERYTAAEQMMFTPGQALNMPGAIEAQASKITNPDIKNFLLNTSAVQRQKAIISIKNMASVLPDAETAARMSPNDMANAFIANRQKTANLSNEFYSKLVNDQINPDMARKAFNDPRINQTIRTAINDDRFDPEIKSRLQQAMEDYTNSGQMAGLNFNDFHELNKFSGKLYSGQTQNKVREAFKSSVLNSNPDWVKANDIYSNAFGEVNQLKSDGLFKDFVNKSSSMFDPKQSGKLGGLINYMQTQQPELLHSMATSKLFDLIGQIGKTNNKTLLPQLQQLRDTVSHNPILTKAIDDITTTLSVPNLKFAPAASSGFGKEAAAGGAGLGAAALGHPLIAAGALAASGLSIIGKLTNHRYQRAFAEIVSNPAKWGPLALQSHSERGGFNKLLDHVSDSIIANPVTQGIHSGIQRLGD